MVYLKEKKELGLTLLDRPKFEKKAKIWYN